MNTRLAKKIVKPMVYLSMPGEERPKRCKAALYWKKKNVAFYMKRKYQSMLGKEDCRVSKAVVVLGRIIRKEERRNETKKV